MVINVRHYNVLFISQLILARIVLNAAHRSEPVLVLHDCSYTAGITMHDCSYTAGITSSYSWATALSSVKEWKLRSSGI